MAIAHKNAIVLGRVHVRGDPASARIDGQVECDPVLATLTNIVTVVRLDGALDQKDTIMAARQHLILIARLQWAVMAEPFDARTLVQYAALELGTCHALVDVNVLGGWEATGLGDQLGALCSV